MSDVAPAEANGQALGPQIRILAQFIRDLSFENPRAPESLRAEGKPEVDVGVEMNARGRADGLFEVEMRLNVGTNTADGPLFTVELIYGGIFQVSGVSEAELETVLLIEAPRHLFPFARQIIANATSDGGFYPPFLLDPLDFAGIYAARKAQGETMGEGMGPIGNA